MVTATKPVKSFQIVPPVRDMAGLVRRITPVRGQRDRPAFVSVTGLMLGSVVAFDAVITCPNCSTTSREVMPGDACQHFYRCAGCGELLGPREGDCCVF